MLDLFFSLLRLSLIPRHFIDVRRTMYTQSDEYETMLRLLHF